MVKKETVKANGKSFTHCTAFGRDNSSAVGPNEGGCGGGTVKPKTGAAYGTQSEHHVGMKEPKTGSSNYA